MNTKQQNALRALKAAESKAWIAAVHDCWSTAEALKKYGEDAPYLTWVQAANALRSFASSLPFGGAK